MAKPRSPIARAALVANGMVWFGLSLMMFGIAAEQTYSAFTGKWFNVAGWFLLVAVAIGLAGAGIIENRNIRAHRTRD